MSVILTPQDVADLLTVSTRTVKDWLREGKLKGTKPGGKVWRILREDFEEFLRSAYVEQTQAAS